MDDHHSASEEIKIKPDAGRDSFRNILSWALYDFANTIFSGIVVTVYFPLYVNDLTGRDGDIGNAVLISMILAGVLVPLMGSVADRTGRTKYYLIRLTVFCCLATCLMSVPGIMKGESSGKLWFVMAMFIVANFTYQITLVFYNSLLPVVASEERAGFASGLGVGLGYLGLVGALIIAGFVSNHLGMRFTFGTGGVLFLLFSIPLYLFVPERIVEKPVELTTGLLKSQGQEILTTLRTLPANRSLMFFFLGNFFIVDALNTMIVMFSVYVEKELEFTGDERNGLLIGLNVSAFVMGVLMGFITDRVGSKKTMIVAVICLGANIFIAGLATSKETLWYSTIVLGAVGVSGIWVAGRKLLLELCPKDKVGEYFGIYGMTGKLSSFGTFGFGHISDAFGRRNAMLSQLITITLGLFFLLKVTQPSTVPLDPEVDSSVKNP